MICLLPLRTCPNRSWLTKQRREMCKVDDLLTTTMARKSDLYLKSQQVPQLSKHKQIRVSLVFFLPMMSQSRQLLSPKGLWSKKLLRKLNQHRLPRPNNLLLQRRSLAEDSAASRQDSFSVVGPRKRSPHKLRPRHSQLLKHLKLKIILISKLRILMKIYDSKKFKTTSRTA